LLHWDATSKVRRAKLIGATAPDASNPMTRQNQTRTFVLVHGVWHGGWCWSLVADKLRARGHRVTTPTHTGLGERSHLLSKAITMDTFVEDLVGHLAWEDLKDVVLVGHSFGGAPITGAADRVPGRIGMLVYLDGAILEDGETWFDLLPPAIAASRKKAAETATGGLSLPVAPLESFGVTKAEHAAFLEGRLTPHPLTTFSTPLKLANPAGNGHTTRYITCTDPEYVPAKLGLGRARDKGWPVSEIKAGHDAMVIAPQATADLLERLACGE
jgi:pimeloyl-ACP methyl ester carboxylesterase